METASGESLEQDSGGYSVTLKKLANGLQVDERIYDDLNAMLTECWRLGMHPVVCSAYRPHATQVRLHNNKIGSVTVLTITAMPPGA